MRDLQSILENAYEDSMKSRWYSGNIEGLNSKSVFMTVPIEDRFEMPVFALSAFSLNERIGGKTPPDSIVINLNYKGSRTTYKSLDANMRNTLNTGYLNARLIKMPGIGDSGRVYLTTQGAVFDDNYNPVMLLTWEMERVYVEETSEYKYKFIRPVLRVKPDVIINKCNAMERYIVNKIIPTALSLNYITTPAIHNTDIIITYYSSRSFKVKVIIDKMPFEVRETDAPSVSTTNEELLKVALDNLEELTQ